MRVQPDLAVRLLERGIKEESDQWRLYQDLGNVYYFDKKDYPKASEAFEAGSKMPGSFVWMKIMAAKIAAEGESLETSYFLWKQIYDAANDPEVKRNAESHLRMLQVQLDCRELDRLAEEYEKRTGHKATRLGELVEAGLLPRGAEGSLGLSLHPRRGRESGMECEKSDDGRTIDAEKVVSPRTACQLRNPYK